jgi:hypothetical protein
MLAFMIYKPVQEQYPTLFPNLTCAANMTHCYEICMFYLLIVYLIILPVTLNIVCQMLEWLLNNELKGM